MNNNNMINTNKQTELFFVVTIRVDGRNLETKPFKAKNKEDAVSIAENKANINFPNAEDIDAVNVEEITKDECERWAGVKQ